MLILGRRVGEEIQIGPDVRITVTHIGRGKCKIGIAAPRTVEVMRAELLLAKKETNGTRD